MSEPMFPTRRQMFRIFDWLGGGQFWYQSSDPVISTNYCFFGPSLVSTLILKWALSRSCLITQTPSLAALLSNDGFPLQMFGTPAAALCMCGWRFCMARIIEGTGPFVSLGMTALRFFLFHPVYKRFSTCLGCVNSFWPFSISFFFSPISECISTHTCIPQGTNCQHACCGDTPALPYVWPQPAIFHLKDFNVFSVSELFNWQPPGQFWHAGDLSLAHAGVI